jgi:hypothetical protein
MPMFSGLNMDVRSTGPVVNKCSSENCRFQMSAISYQRSAITKIQATTMFLADG